jgi:peroxin-13
MTTQSPKKPWETGQANITTQPQTQPQTVSSQPAIPTRPTSNIGINGMGAVGYGQTGAYGGIGTGMGGYGNSYAGMGGYGQSTYGGIGGYGQNSYGGYGGNSYGMNRMSSYGGGMNSYGGGYGNQRFGMNGMGMNGVPTMQQQMEQSTQSTFQMLDQVVQTFGGFSQMLESTFFATHSSFMAMIGILILI